LPPHPLPDPAGMTPIAIVGAGPAGLHAAEILAGAGRAVAVYDAMPAPGRKLLVAGHGGLNLTHSEPLEAFARRYGANHERFARWLRDFGPEQLRSWADGLGAETFVGTSGRVFPKAFKAAALLGAWLDRLRSLGVRFHPRHRLIGVEPGPRLRFAGPGGESDVAPAAALLALGGASWPETGSDAAWVPLLAAHGIAVRPLMPANCGFETVWSERLRGVHAGAPLKTIGLAFAGQRARGEIVITAYGLEGGGLYPLGAALRDALARRAGPVVLELDLKPDLDEGTLLARLSEPRDGASLATVLRKRLRLDPPAIALVNERTTAVERRDPTTLATRIKALPIALTRTRPLGEAISTAGGIPFAEVDDHLRLLRLPGVSVAGEMLDWEAPTGGYLLQGCFTTGARAAAGILCGAAR
jgi:uncharacterized flavoprotein (TIGR03862 family)